MRKVVEIYGNGIAKDGAALLGRIAEHLPGVGVVVVGLPAASFRSASLPAGTTLERAAEAAGEGIVLVIAAGSRLESGSRPHILAHVPPPGETADPDADLAAGGRLACAAAEEICERAGLPRSFLGKLLDALGVKLTACQFGCF